MKAWLLLCFVPSLALAEPRIETIDRGDAVEVIAHDITAANTTLIPVRSRLEIAVTGKPAAFNTPSTDPTIVISELDSHMLSVKTAFDRSEIKAVAPLAKAIQVGPDLHIMIPRKLPAAGTTIELPEPTVPSVAKLELPVAPAPEAPNVEAKPAPVPAPAVVETKPAPPVTEVKPPLPTQPSSAANPLTKPSMLGVLALVAIGCGIWVMKRRKKTQAPVASIDIIAQRQLGSKAKIVWLSAGTREMVIAITPQNVRMLGQWKKSDGPPAEIPAYTDHNLRARLPTAQVVEPLVDRSSPAVAGLLKLRARTVQPTSIERDEHVMDDDVASGDIEADALWAKEILMATRANTHRSAR